MNLHEIIDHQKNGANATAAARAYLDTGWLPEAIEAQQDAAIEYELARFGMETFDPAEHMLADPEPPTEGQAIVVLKRMDDEDRYFGPFSDGDKASAWGFDNCAGFDWHWQHMSPVNEPIQLDGTEEFRVHLCALDEYQLERIAVLLKQDEIANPAAYKDGLIGEPINRLAYLAKSIDATIAMPDDQYRRDMINGLTL